MKDPHPLKSYQEKRDFSRTPEPEGTVAPLHRQASFFIQKHDASHLHYDLRLEMEGVLKSWAVPKEPSLDPAVSRLAIHVEDHPLDYGTFEGVIPKGQYGAGTVVLWDEGTWIPEKDPVDGYRQGHLVFSLEGKRLRGRFSLVRWKRPEEDRGKKEHWLLRKLKDAPSRTQPGTSRAGTVPPRSAPAPFGKPGPLPAVVEPELATLVREAPEGDGWLHEIKFDGVRLLAFLDRGKARLVSRNNLDWTGRLPFLAKDLAERLPAGSALLDGELVAMKDGRVSDFGLLKEALGRRDQANLVYWVFDLLFLDGQDLRDRPLLERKTLLKSLLEKAGGSRLRYCDHVMGKGPLFFAASCGEGLEGIVSKRQDAPYRSGRTREWVKVKCQERQEFVIVGFTNPRSSRQGLGALLLAVHEGSGLRYSGRVGTGFSEKVLTDLRARLGKLERARPPVTDALSTAERRGVHWVEPRLVAEVSFLNWTRDHRLRQPSFLGLREDKEATDVVREEPAPPPALPDRSRGPTGPRLTHPDRILYPRVGITKRDLAGYYEIMAPRLLPHVEGRLLSLVRCPEGEGKPCFYQKHPMVGLPRAVKVARYVESGEESLGLYVDDAEGLISLAQIGTLEIHPWGSRVADLEHPDRCTFDLDPGPDVPWESVVQAARDLRGRLRRLGLDSFPKTTGGKGLHVVVPFQASVGWKELKAFAKIMADTLARDDPGRFTSSLAKSRRVGKIFIDYLRNGRGATAVAAYSPRARPHAPISMPLAWEELTPALRPEAYTVTRIQTEKGRSRDPWRRFFEARQTLPPPKSLAG
jgi:bifunctional non-homologous end joining protein LigD